MWRLIKTIFHRGWLVIYSYFAWMRKYAKKPSKYPMDIRYKKLRNLILKINKSFKVKLIVTGLENIPDSTFCCVANHMSGFDPLAFIAANPVPTTFVAKKELEHIPFISKCVKGLEGDFLDRDDLKQSLKLMLNVQKDLKENKHNWLIFPEGTRIKDQMGLVGDFHSGTFRAPMRANATIVPVALYGTFRVIKFKKKFKKYPVFVSFLKPITPEEYQSLTTEQVSQLAHDSIQKEISFSLRKKDQQIMMEDKKYIFNKII